MHNKAFAEKHMQLARRLCQVVAVLLLINLLFGCENNTQAKAEGIHIQAVNFPQWDKQLAQYQPNIVVVDAWAMWCTSCIKRFPKMVEMQQKYADKPVRFVSLNLDDHQDQAALAQAQEFLVKINATFDHYHMNENLIDAFDHFKLIGIPAVFIFDGSSKERFRLTGDNPNSQFTDTDIEQAVIQLLNER